MSRDQKLGHQVSSPDGLFSIGAGNPKKKRRPAEANRHLPVNSKSLIELLMIGVHDLARRHSTRGITF